jgi:hypothetical protein
MTLAALGGKIMNIQRSRTFARIERRLNDASPAYDATRTNRLRSEIGWTK